MGYFSWETSDTNESIANISSGHPNSSKTVYLLQPNGKTPISESAYNGYGVFDNIDAYEWISINSMIPELTGITDPQSLRLIGLSISLNSDIYEDHNGKHHSFHFFPYPELGIIPFAGTYSTIPEFGKCPNDLIESGEWRIKTFIDVIKLNFPEFVPAFLKFSFDKNAVYEDLPIARNCPHQGFFY